MSQNTFSSPLPLAEEESLIKGRLQNGGEISTSTLSRAESQIPADWYHQVVREHPVTHQGVGLNWERKFSPSGDPYRGILWERRDARIVKGDGTTVFEQKGVEVPSFWSQTATDIVASKYFRGKLNSLQRETSAKQMVERVADVIADWGWRDGYFATEEDYLNFRDDLRWLLIHQYGAFNSPVWFNVGVYERPQCSACFILSVEDNMQSILDWYRDEGWIFKFGSGAGLNLSCLRSSKEPLSRGGFSSGPVSFMKGADGVANSIRSGGTTRRAAKMVVLNIDHPDIKDFIFCKKNIEEMTRALLRSGIKDSIAADIFDPYTLLPYQNANNSVRVTDEFMRAVENDAWWELKAVTTGEAIERVRAREIMDWIAEAAWHSADPGMQFDTSTNYWHTCPQTGRINASNPCSEYMSLDNSACNLASLNLLKFFQPDGSFAVERYKQAIDTFIVAQDILVDNSSYPTEKIMRNARDYRQLGLGYANLGALLMTLGLPYDSDEGRALAGALTAVLTGRAYRMSAELSRAGGPFRGYQVNEEAMLRVINQHRQAAEELAGEIEERGRSTVEDLKTEAVQSWQEAWELGQEYGYRNSQATVLAPTGTIAFLMDCATTGVEPELALVKYKKLVGGGTLKLVNHQVTAALRRLGYGEEESEKINRYVLEKGVIEEAPGLKEEHLPVFDCSFRAPHGQRSIHYLGHIKMMARVQPFISGAISKTVNLPKETTKEEVREAFVESWRQGLKAVAFYRDESKTIQPLNTKAEELVEKINGHTRVKLPDTRPSLTHKFSVGGHEGYLTVGLYPDTKKVGETFIRIAKEGSTVSGLLDVVATLTSIALQSGVPLKILVRKFKDIRFEPSGPTTSEEMPFAKSIIDYIFKYLGYNFLTNEEKEEIFGTTNPLISSPAVLEPITTLTSLSTIPPAESKKNPATSMLTTVVPADSEAMVCECGSIMARAGSCYSCPNCFATTGVCN